MSKNLTRKGLAFGALVALTSTVIAGTPAMAAGEINVVPSAGTSYTTLAGAQFNLSTTFAPGFAPAAYSQLKYLVKTDANSTVKFAADLDAADVVTELGLASAQAISTTSAAVSAEATAATDVAILGLSAVTTTVSSSVEVTAFVDANNDGALTSGEWSTVRTVNFKKAADIVPVVSLTAPAAGDTSLKATVAWGDLNIEQLTNETVKFTSGTQLASATAGTLATGTWSKTVVTPLAASEAVTAQAYIGSTALGTAASATASARSINTVNGLVANVVAGNDSTATAATAVAAATAAVVRTNGTFTTQVKAYDISAGATTASTVVKSGVAVTASVSGTFATALRPASTGVTEISVTVNGTKYTTNASLAAASVALTTDASGVASVVVSSKGLSAADKITVSFAGQNITAGIEATQTDASYTVVSTAVGSAERSIAEGGSATFNYAVKDQFGVAISATSRLKVVVGYTTPVTSYVNLVNGAGSVTVTDTTENTDADIAVAAGLQTQDATTLNWSPDAPTVSAAVQTVNVTATALAFDTVPVNQNIALSTSVALTTASVNNPGAAVTVSSPGVTFTVGGKDYVDTVTLFSAATTGDIVVSAKSNIAGAHTITYTAGSVVKTSVVTVAAAAETAGASIDLSSVPATIVPGSTLVYTGYLKDVYGNGVDTNQGANDVRSGASTFSVVYSGPGFIVGGSEPTKTDANGKFTFTVILGANDSGSASVTVKYDADGATTTIAEISKTATTSIAKAAPAAATAAASGSTGKVYVSVTNAAGKTVVVKINGKFAKSFVGTSAKKVVAVVASKGAKNVSVYVSGKALVSKVITVK